MFVRSVRAQCGGARNLRQVRSGDGGIPTVAVETSRWPCGCVDVQTHAILAGCSGDRADFQIDMLVLVLRGFGSALRMVTRTISNVWAPSRGQKFGLRSNLELQFRYRGQSVGPGLGPGLVGLVSVSVSVSRIRSQY